MKLAGHSFSNIKSKMETKQCFIVECSVRLLVRLNNTVAISYVILAVRIRLLSCCFVPPFFG